MTHGGANTIRNLSPAAVPLFWANPQAALAAIDEARYWPETAVPPWLSRLHALLGGAKSAPVTDRRVAPRYKVELNVTLVSRGHSVRARSCDLSQTGMGLYANCDLDLGEQLMLQYELGDGSPPKKVTATVRNRTGNRYGVEFGE